MPACSPRFHGKKRNLIAAPIAVAGCTFCRTQEFCSAPLFVGASIRLAGLNWRRAKFARVQGDQRGRELDQWNFRTEF